MPSAPEDRPRRPVSCCAARPAGPSPCPRTGGGAPRRGAGSYRHDPVLLPGPLDLLGRRHLEGTDEDGACLARIDDVVDERSPRRDVGIDELAKLLDPARALRLRVGGGRDLLAKADVGPA